MKEYTPLRRFYAIVGFIHLILYACLGVYALTKIEKEPQQQPESVKIIEVTNEKPAETEKEYIKVSKKTESQPVITQAVSVPVQQPIVYKKYVQQSKPIEQDEPEQQINTDIEWQSLCFNLADLTGNARENYPRAMKSYQSCAGIYLGIAQNMANGGLAGAVFNAELQELSTEYQSLSSQN